jgi:uncharacterized membrane protein
MKTNILFGCLLVTIGALAYLLFQKSDSNIVDYNKKQIDSLNVINAGLQKQQEVQDSIIDHYKVEVLNLDHKIDSTEHKLKDLRIHYGKKIRNAGNYTPTELDSFFTNRYKQDTIKN